MYLQTPEGKDPQLWDRARRRSSFKNDLTSYLVMCAFFWVLWYFTGGRNGGGLPWPFWPTLGWGIGVAMHYIDAYVSPRDNNVEKEYDKLIKNNRINN